MDDKRIVPVPVSVYKAEVWPHLGFYGNVRKHFNFPPFSRTAQKVVQ